VQCVVLKFPSLSHSQYNALDPSIEIICYKGGYKGLLSGNSVVVDVMARKTCSVLQTHGGSPIGNSRVKLTNVADCVKRGLVKEGDDPQKVAADQLVKDGVTILHTVGGDDTNLTAAELAKFLKTNQYDLTVVGMPKTIDNDVVPIRQSLGAWTAAEQGALFFSNVVNEMSANPRMLIIHECMGRDCGYLTAATAEEYRKSLKGQWFLDEMGFGMGKKDVHAVFIPEISVDIKSEAARLKAVMDEHDCVNIFLSEGAGVKDIVAQMEAAGQEVPRDAFGHVKLDKVNPGQWFAAQFGPMIGAEKVLVQKSGYFARSAAANQRDRALIESCAALAVTVALKGESGCVGHDEERGDELRAIEFERIKGGKAFDVELPWFKDMLKAIGQAS
jgi:pyrophosphate--fructose-6-phosphate 1-phosphotransferase